MESGGMWKPRMTSSAQRIYSEVEYISSDEQNYLDFDLRVRYEPEESPFGGSARFQRVSVDNSVSNEERLFLLR